MIPVYIKFISLGITLVGVIFFSVKYLQARRALNKAVSKELIAKYEHL